MNSFLIRRLAIFLIGYFCIEFFAAAYLAITNFSNMDWTFKTIIQDIGVLQLTSLVSFLFMVFPYVIYLSILPEKYQNTPFDKYITYGFFTIFIFLNLLENISSIIFWSEFSALKQTDSSIYLKQAQQILAQIYSQYPLGILLSSVLIISLLGCFVCRKFLFTRLPAPSYTRRFFHLTLYIAVSVLAFINIDFEKLNNQKNIYNSRISEDETYSLFHNFVKRNSRLMLLRHNRNNKLDHPEHD